MKRAAQRKKHTLPEKNWNLSSSGRHRFLQSVLELSSFQGNEVKAAEKAAILVARAAGCDLAVVELYKNGTAEVEYVAQYGTRRLPAKTIRIPARQSPVHKVYKTGKVVHGRGFRGDVAGTPFVGRYKDAMFVAAPVKTGGKVLGVITALSLAGRKPGEQVLFYVEAAGAALGSAIAGTRISADFRTASEQLNHFFHRSPNAFLVVKPADNTIVDANESALRLTGWERNALLGRSILAIHTADDAEAASNLLKTVKASGRSRIVRSLHMLNNAGRSIPVEINIRTVRYSGERRFVYMVRDISDELKAEVQLRASEELLRLIVEGTPDVFFYVHNTQGIFTYVSPSVEKITGHTVESWKDHYAKFVTDNPINNALRDYTERAITKGETPPGYFGEIFHADGRRIMLEIHERPVFKDGQVIGVQGFARDTTEQQRWQRSLVESEKKYRSLFNSVRDGIFQCDAEGQITDINQAGAEMLGYSDPKGVIGQKWAHFFVNDEDRQQVIKGVREEGFVRLMEFEARQRNGGTILMEGSATGVFNEVGRITGYDGTFRDVSERKRLEEHLIQSQKMESIGLLAGGIAHDFNNILGGILGYASYLKSVVPAEDKIQAHLATIERSALRAAELTSKLLAFARGGKYVVKPININSVIDETLRLLRGSLDKSIVIEEELAADLPAIEADAGQIQQVLMNLCVNARDAMPSGGTLTLASELVPPTDPFLAAQPAVKQTNYIRVSVNDTGTGIDKGIQNRIFDPFFTTKEKGKGTGLGLATVYGIVRNHNGFIEVQSVVGMGSRFLVYFPAVDASPVEVEENVAPSAGGTETLLVVDDEETIRELAVDILGGKGYTVLQAANGAEAAELLMKKRRDIALVILDMMMPEMGGKETFVKLRQVRPDLRVILSTGYAEDERTQELYKMGVKAFVQKPYRSTELAATVRRVLDDKDA